MPWQNTLPATQAIAGQANLYPNASQAGLQTIAASSTLTFSAVTPSPVAGYSPCLGLSYEIQLQLVGNVSATVPFAVVTLTFYEADSASAIPIETVQWVCSVGNGTTGGFAGGVIAGHGPLRGNYMKVTVQNLDTLSMQASVTMLGTSRIYTRDVWTEQTGYPVAGFTRPSSLALATNYLGAVASLTVGVGATVARLFPMWSGYIWLDQLDSGGVASPNLDFTLQAMPTGFFTVSNVLDQFPGGTSVAGLSNNPFGYYVSSPRCPLRAQWVNSGSVAATVNLVMVAQESAA